MTAFTVEQRTKGVGIRKVLGATVLIVLLTVSYQAVRAALNNPVKSLRYE